MFRLIPRSVGALCVGLALAAPVSAGGTVVTTVQAGAWNDPAVWDLGAPPSLADDAQAQLRHPLTVDAPGAEANVLIVESGNFVNALRLVDGGALEANLAVLGTDVHRGNVDHSGGAAQLDELRIGTQFDVGYYGITGGTLATDRLDVGTFTGSSGPASGRLEITGPDAQVSASERLRVASDSSYIEFHPTADGAAGLTPVVTHDVVLQDGALLRVGPNYQAEVGHRWDLISYTGNLTGTVELISLGAVTVALDTSTPGVIAAVVIDSPFPLPGDACADAIALDPAGETLLFDMGLKSTELPGPNCFSGGLVGADIWFSLTNDTTVARAWDLQMTEAFVFVQHTGWEVYDACGGTLLHCDGVGSTDGFLGGDADEYPQLEVVLQPGEQVLLRWVVGAVGGYPFVLDVTPVGVWEMFGEGLAGVAGEPVLTGLGALTQGDNTNVHLTGHPNSAVALFIGVGAGTPVPFKQGTLYPVPIFKMLFTHTNFAGFWSTSFAWPADVPSGFVLELQAAVLDPGAPAGLALTRGLRAITP